MRDVLRHVVDTNRDFRAATSSSILRPAACARTGVRAHAFTQEVLRDGRGETELEGYFGPTTVAEVIDRYGTDLLVHRWDIACAAGATEHEALDDADAAHYSEVAQRRRAADGRCSRSGGLAPADATTGERLIAFSWPAAPLSA